MANGTKFCPKCGATLIESARFCGKCGYKFETASIQPAAVNQMQSPTNPMTAPGSSNYVVPTVISRPGMGFAGNSTVVKRLASVVLAVLTIIFMALDWVSIPALKTAGSFSSWLGISSSVLKGDYPMYGLGDLGSLIDMGTGDNSGSILATFCTTVWIIALLLLLAGLVVMFATKKHSTGLLAAGGIVVAVVAVVWIAVIGYMNGLAIESMKSASTSLLGSSSAAKALGTQYIVATAWPVVSAITGAVTAVLAIMARPSKKKANISTPVYEVG